MFWDLVLLTVADLKWLGKTRRMCWFIVGLKQNVGFFAFHAPKVCFISLLDCISRQFPAKNALKLQMKLFQDILCLYFVCPYSVDHSCGSDGSAWFPEDV